MLNVFSEKDKLSGKECLFLSVMNLEQNATIFLTNYLVVAEWETTNPPIMLILSVYDPRISRKVRNHENNSYKTKLPDALGISLSLSHLEFKTWMGIIPHRLLELYNRSIH